jgi:thiamine pyrophosphate-dependent acetolactate synthase large subunit-like protein
MTGGDIVADVLVRQGVRFLFTLCGGHISPILVSAKARGIRIVDTRHEATAVFAADAVARLTGLTGVAAVTAGPGVTNTITALKNAQMAPSPLVLLGGATATLLRGRGALQDVDQMALVSPHVKRASRTTRLRDLGPALDEAFRPARHGVPGPVFLECPVDLLYPEARAAQRQRSPRERSAHRVGSAPSSAHYRLRSRFSSPVSAVRRVGGSAGRGLRVDERPQKRRASGANVGSTVSAGLRWVPP